ncbi:hypothetical protein IAT38_000175 [Cryptococcus sp. DSM 104549]
MDDQEGPYQDDFAFDADAFGAQPDEAPLDLYTQPSQNTFSLPMSTAASSSNPAQYMVSGGGYGGAPSSTASDFSESMGDFGSPGSLLASGYGSPGGSMNAVTPSAFIPAYDANFDAAQRVSGSAKVSSSRTSGKKGKNTKTYRSKDENKNRMRSSRASARQTKDDFNTMFNTTLSRLSKAKTANETYRQQLASYGYTQLPAAPQVSTALAAPDYERIEVTPDMFAGLEPKEARRQIREPASLSEAG